MDDTIQIVVIRVKNLEWCNRYPRALSLSLSLSLSSSSSSSISSSRNSVSLAVWCYFVAFVDSLRL